MEKGKLVAYAIVLAPAIVTSLLCLRVFVYPAIERWIDTNYSDRHTVEFAKEMIAHASFYGSVLASVFGKKEDVLATALIAGAWFVFCLLVAYNLVKRLRFLESEGDHSQLVNEVKEADHA